MGYATNGREELRTSYELPFPYPDDRRRLRSQSRAFSRFGCFNTKSVDRMRRVFLPLTQKHAKTRNQEIACFWRVAKRIVKSPPEFSLFRSEGSETPLGFFRKVRTEKDKKFRKTPKMGCFSGFPCYQGKTQNFGLFRTPKRGSKSQSFSVSGGPFLIILFCHSRPRLNI